jgi:soluble P-type ATPase/iron-sulfur cluster repair protein YtfE (RIC family)
MAAMVSAAEPDWVAPVRRRAGAHGMVTVFVGVDGSLAGILLLRDQLRPDAPRTFRLLRRAGVRRAVMVTGDRSSVAAQVAARIGADDVYADQSPADKVTVVRDETAAAGTIMVGDGVNDAPALAAADVGVALGARGASASSEAADVVITVDRLERLAETLAIARRTRSIARQSAVLGMGLSLVAMGAAAAGVLTPLAGAVVQEVIDVAAILNALRALGPGRSRTPRLRGDSAELVRRLDDEHRRLEPRIAALPELAAELPTLGAGQLDTRLAEMTAFLRDELLPHERDDERLLYPHVAAALGGADPTATMSYQHAEIAEQVERIDRLADEVRLGIEDQRIGLGSSYRAAVLDLGRALYELHAVLRLHNASEEENFHVLAE